MTTTIRDKYLSVLIGSASVACVPGPAWAQVASDSMSVVAEVIVTARKREENLQEVPDSITAVGATELEESRVSAIDDINGKIANFHVVHDQDPGTNIITVRGIGTSRLLASAVAYSVDGVILPDADAFLTDLSDAQSVEVLRGPQGALYGRNAIAGVVNVTTQRPTADPSGEVRASYGNNDSMELFGAVSGPVAGDRLLGRFSGKLSRTDGWLENQFDGRKVDHDRRGRVAGRLIFEATDDLSFDLRLSHVDQRGGAAPLSSFDVLGTTGGEITDDLASIEPNLDARTHSTWRVSDAAFVAEWQTGVGTLTSISAYDRVDVGYQADLDATPISAAVAQQSRGTRGKSQELRFTSPSSDRLRYIVGAYYSKTEREIHSVAGLDYCFLLPLPFCPTPPGTTTALTFADAAWTRGDFEQSAVFAQTNYDLTDALELTAALRYDRDSREQLDRLTQRVDSAAFDKLQPKVSLAWKITPQHLLYGTFAEGFKSGGFNPPPPPGAAFSLVVDQEETRSYEAGFKSTFWEDRLRANLAVFYTDYTNPQMLRLDLQSGAQVALNANEARIRGGELEISMIPLPGWELHAAGGYSDATIRDFDGTDTFRGNTLPNAPDYTLNVGTRYSRKLWGDLGLLARMDVNFIGRTYFAEDNLISQPDYHTVDAMLGLETSRWSASLWGRNIFSENYAVSAFARSISPLLFGQLGVDPYQIAPGAQYGVAVSFKF